MLMFHELLTAGRKAFPGRFTSKIKTAVDSPWPKQMGNNEIIIKENLRKSSVIETRPSL